VSGGEEVVLWFGALRWTEERRGLKEGGRFGRIDVWHGGWKEWIWCRSNLCDLTTRCAVEYAYSLGGRVWKDARWMVR
jgi:hypothetical protein